MTNTMGVGDVYLPRSLLHDSINPPIAWPYTPWIKLKASVSLETADAELGAIVRQFAKEFPNRYPNKFHLQLQPIIVPFEQNTNHILFLLLAGVLVLLLIGCANCSILLLARGAARQHELAIRSAMGASRWRIVRQLLIESIVVAFSGAILGTAASYWLAQLPLRLSPASFPSESVIRISIPILAFSIGLAFTSGVVFGLLPALRLSRPDLTATMQSSRGQTKGVGAGQRLNVLVAGQIALTLVLMTAAAMAIGAFLRLTKVPLGYDPKNVMQAGIVMHWNDPIAWSGIQSRESRAAFIDRVRQSIASVPGVVSVAVGTDSTPPYSGVQSAIKLAGRVSTGETEARVHTVSSEFFPTLRIALLQGRLWDQPENARGDLVAVVNRSFAQQYWPRGGAIGQQLEIPGLKSIGPLDATSAASAGWRQVIGVVADARDDGIDRPVVPAIYVPYTTAMPPFAHFLIRTQGEPLSLLHSIRAAVQSVSADQQIANDAFDLEQAIERDSQWSRQHLFSILFGSFSAIAAVIALAGIFSVVSYSVAQRTTELGVRMALGASRMHILWVASRTALVSVGTGIVTGVLLNLFLAKILAAWMDNRYANFPGVLTVALLLAICTCAACLLTARRAMHVHPSEALRNE